MSKYYSDDWDHYLDNVATNSSIPDSQKYQLTKAIQTLRKNLGESWPSESRETNHRILWELRIISGAVSDGLIVIWGDSMSAAEKVEGFSKILAKIRRHDCFDGTIAELEIAGRLAGRGCLTKIEPGAGRKSPDLLIHDGKSRLFIEVKTLLTASETTKATNTTVGILVACRPIFPIGIIFKPLSEPHLKEVTGILEQEAKRAIINKTDVMVDTDKVLKLYLVPDGLPERFKMLMEWHRKQKESGVMPSGSGRLYGPSDNVRQEYRTRIRISNFAKERQIPPEETGILILAGQFLFQDANDVEGFVDSIIEAVYELKNIPAVVLVSAKTFGDADAWTVEREDFIYIRNRLYEGIREDVVIVKNRFFEPEFDYENLKSLLRVN